MENGSSYGTYAIYIFLGAFLLVLVLVLLRLAILAGLLCLAPMRDVAEWIKRRVRGGP